MKFETLFLCSVLFAAGCSASSSGTNVSADSYIYSVPKTNTAFPVATLNQAGIAEATITDIVKDILRGQYGNVDSFLIVKDNQLILEEYFNDYDRNKPHDLRSTTKSLTALITGIAVQSGYLPGVQATVYDYFPNYAMFDNWHSIKSQITVENLLMMSSGLACQDGNPNSVGREAFMYHTNDWVKFILDLPVNYTPGKYFSYCTGGVVTLGALIESAVQQDLTGFADQRLFQPLGITDYYWAYTPTGRVDTGGHIYMTPLDMAKIGSVVLNNGMWQGKQIISADWVTEMTTPHFEFYGYLWWIATLQSTPPGSKVIYYTSGNGGQHIYVIPYLSTIVVFTGSNYGKPSRMTDLLIEQILPAI